MMRRWTVLLCACLLAGPVAAATPSQASVEQLLDVMKSRQMLSAMHDQIDQIMAASVDQAVEGEQISPAERDAIDQMQQEMTALLKESLNWNTLKTKFVSIYQQSFEQSEVDAMIEFYASDAGQSVVEKMPAVMQRTMSLVQQNMQSMLPEVRAIQQRFAERIRAINADG